MDENHISVRITFRQIAETFGCKRPDDRAFQRWIIGELLALDAAVDRRDRDTGLGVLVGYQDKDALVFDWNRELTRAA